MTDKLERRSQGGVTRAARLSSKRRSAIARAGGLAKAAKAPPPVTEQTVEEARTALTLLTSIRTQFRGWGCASVADRLEHAISSAKGAVRNMEHKADKAR